LVVRLATEHPNWGDDRMAGILARETFTMLDLFFLFLTAVRSRDRAASDPGYRRR
jgi:hypothetical protein